MDWFCSSCGRHFNWSVSECPHCRFQTTVTTSGTQPTSTNIAMPKCLCKENGYHYKSCVGRVVTAASLSLTVNKECPIHGSVIGTSA
jgi:hypothetical protein